MATGLLGALLGASGLVFAMPSLVVPGVGLLLIVATAGAWVAVGARRAGLVVEAAPVNVEESRPVMVRARARIGRGAPPAELVLPSLGRAELGRGGRRRTLEVVTRFERRGLRSVGPARLVVSDPLGLSSRVAAERSADVLVLPRIEAVRAPRGLGPEGVEGRRGSGRGPELEFEGLRPYRSGAPAARIHWPTAARTGQLLERHLSPEADTHPLVVLDPSDPANGDALDSAVRATASLCRALALAGGCRLVLPGDRRAQPIGPDLRAFGAVHARLALLEPDATAVRMPRPVGGSTLFWVLAARRGAPRALLRASARERYLVVPGDARQGARAFEVAGCTGLRVQRSGVRAA